MDALQIKTFIDAMASSGLSEMEVAKDGWTLRLVRGVAPCAAAPSTPAADSEPKGTSLQAATLGGVVFLQPAPGAAPFAEPGQAVRAGQTLCVIEAMKVFNEVHAERDGVVDAYLVESGQEVDAGQALVRWR